MEEREKLLLEIKGLIADSQKEGVKKADLDNTIKELNDKIAKLGNDDIKALKASVDDLLKATSDNAAAIKAMNETAKKSDPEKPMTFKEALIAAVQESAKLVPSLLTEKSDSDGKRQSLVDYFNKLGHKNTPEMTVKVGVDMLESTIAGNYVNHIRLTELDPNRVTTPLTFYPHVTDWMPVKGISKKFMSILVVGTYFDGAGTKTEGSSATLSSFYLTTVEFASVVIGTKFRLSDETLDDLPEAMEEIALVGPSKIKDNIDSQILGTAGNDTTTIKGMYVAAKHTDFAGSTTYLATIPQANEIDVIETMKLQAATSKYKADTVIMNPADIMIITAQKDQLDNSRTDRRVVFNALGEPIAIGGLVVRANDQQTANTCCVLDSKQVQIGDRKQMTLEVGYDADDFSTGHKTVRVNVRLAFAVRDALAVIYCDDLSAAVTNINKA